MGKISAFALYSLILMLAVLPLAFTHQSIGSVVDTLDTPRLAANSWATAHLPGTLLPFFQGATRLLASPLLYLILIGVFLAEYFIPANPDQERFSRGFIQDFCTWFLLDAPLKAAASGAALCALYFILESYFPTFRLSDAAAASVPTSIRVLMAVVVGDLFMWIHHFLTHKIKILWFFHSVHHSQQEMNLFTELRFHVLETVTLAPIFYAPFYVLNLDFEAAFLTILVIQWYSRIYHANLRSNFGPLRYVLVTPQSHRIHHSREACHQDRNFGTIFCFWDRLLGTQWSDYEEYPSTGIADETFPWEESVRGTDVLANYFAQLLYPFRRILEMLR